MLSTCRGTGLRTSEFPHPPVCVHPCASSAPRTCWTRAAAITRQPRVVTAPAASRLPRCLWSRLARTRLTSRLMSRREKARISPVFVEPRSNRDGPSVGTVGRRSPLFLRRALTRDFLITEGPTDARPLSLSLVPQSSFTRESERRESPDRAEAARASRSLPRRGGFLK